MKPVFVRTKKFVPPLVLFFFMFSSVGTVAQKVSDTDVTKPEKFMLEASAAYTSDKNGVRTETLSFPAAVLRTGVREGTELQVGWKGYQWKRIDYQNKEHGAGDGVLALKQLISKETITAPRTAIKVGTSLPTGSDDFTSDRFDPFALGVFEYSLGARVTTEVHAGVEWITEIDAGGNKDTDAAGVYAAAVYYRLNLDNEIFLESFGDIPINGDETPAHTLDIGTVRSLSKDVEIATWYGRGLSDAAEDHLFATELTISF